MNSNIYKIIMWIIITCIYNPALKAQSQPRPADQCATAQIGVIDESTGEYLNPMGSSISNLTLPASGKGYLIAVYIDSECPFDVNISGGNNPVCETSVGSNGNPTYSVAFYNSGNGIEYVSNDIVDDGYHWYGNVYVRVMSNTHTQPILVKLKVDMHDANLIYDEITQAPSLHSEIYYENDIADYDSDFTISGNIPVADCADEFVYYWEYRDVNGKWNPCPGDNSSNDYQVISHKQIATFRRHVSCGNNQSTSNELTIDVGRPPGVIRATNIAYVMKYSPRVPMTTGLDISEASPEELGVTIEYSNGLGRPIQNIAVAQSPGGYDMVEPIKYDNYGRVSTKFLPYVLSDKENKGELQDDPDMFSKNSGPQFNFYNDENTTVAVDPFPYAQIVYDNSPLNRVKEQGAAGAHWQPNGSGAADDGHTLKYEYGFNTHSNSASDLVRNLVVEDGQLKDNGLYIGNMLVKTVTKNENWVSGKLFTTEEYKDSKGQVVLSRSYVGNESDPTPVETYYVYDHYGQLTFVIPPEASKVMFHNKGEESENYQLVSNHKTINNIEDGVNSYLVSSNGSLTLGHGYHFAATTNNTLSISAGNASSNMIYEYSYDAKGRMIEKRIPGAATVYMVYDKLDRLVASQDGEMRENNQWLFTKYDIFSRPIITGVFSSTYTRIQMQGFVNGFYSTAPGVKFGETPNGNYHGYTNTTFPTTASSNDYYTISYYDNYDWLNTNTDDYFDDLVNLYQDHGLGVEIPSIWRFDQVKGLTTGSKTKVLDNSNTWLQNVTFYDDKYRAILVQSDNYVGLEDVIINDYDFVANLKETWLCHRTSLGDNPKRIIRQVNAYDHAGRLLTTQQQMTDDKSLVTISDNTYNELGELVSKSVGDDSQTLDYAYNIRGWLTGINDINKPRDAKKQFAMHLSYLNTPHGVHKSLDEPKLYNGNISAIEWEYYNDGSGVGPGTKQAYGFSYDGLNRIVDARYGEYSMLGKQYWNLNNDFGMSIESYDLNGNINKLIRNEAKEGIVDDLEYTYMGNMLMEVTDHIDHDNGFTDGNTNGNDYAYDLNGNMTTDKNKGLKSVEYNYLNLPKKLIGNKNNTIEYIYDAGGNKLMKKGSDGTNTYYSDSFIYEQQGTSSRLDYIMHGEGKFVMSNGTGEYQFDIKDHLGNVRMVVDNNSIKEQESAYYPFGMTFLKSGSNGNKYLYNGKELQEDLIGYGNLDWLDYGSRMYDSEIGRWHVIDPVVEKFYGVTPYRYGLNNPLRFVDPDGESEKDRVVMVAWAKVFIYHAQKRFKERNEHTYHYAGWHNGVPYLKIDCSGLVSQVSYFSGNGYLNNSVKGAKINWRLYDKNLKKYYYTEGPNNGVANIIDQSHVKKITMNEIQPGNIFAMSNRRKKFDGTHVGHTGFISKVIREENLGVVGFNIIHSQDEVGPNEMYVDLRNNDFYGKASYTFYSIDTEDSLEDYFFNKKINSDLGFRGLLGNSSFEERVDYMYKEILGGLSMGDMFLYYVNMTPDENDLEIQDWMTSTDSW